MQKPIIIYSLARSKSTATLQASRRDNLMNEPFDAWAAIDNYVELVTRKKPASRTDLDNLLLSSVNWNELQQQMQHSSAAIKFFGTSLHHYYPAQKWFNDVLKNNTHEVFVLLRNLEDLCWSLILASEFGFAKSSLRKPYRMFTVPNAFIENCSRNIDCFLDFYPKGKQIITFETLPTEFFDYSKIVTTPQKSQDKKFLVENFNYVEDQIRKLLENKKDRWEDITQTNIYTNW